MFLIGKTRQLRKELPSVAVKTINGFGNRVHEVNQVKPCKEFMRYLVKPSKWVIFALISSSSPMVPDHKLTLVHHCDLLDNSFIDLRRAETLSFMIRGYPPCSCTLITQFPYSSSITHALNMQKHVSIIVSKGSGLRPYHMTVQVWVLFHYFPYSCPDSFSFFHIAVICFVVSFSLVSWHAPFWEE